MVLRFSLGRDLGKQLDTLGACLEIICGVGNSLMLGRK